jgi:DNA-binding response OmpR family regulator
MIIALELEASLRELGVENVTVAGSVREALAALSDGIEPDFAILDHNLGTETSEPVARKLQSSGIPFIFASGYTDVEERISALQPAGFLVKPYSRRSLETYLRQYGA